MKILPIQLMHPLRTQDMEPSENPQPQEWSRVTGAVAGIVATAGFLGLADLLARAFAPSAAPLVHWVIPSSSSLHPPFRTSSSTSMSYRHWLEGWWGWRPWSLC